MNPNKELANELIKSLDNDWQYWDFGEYVATNSKTKIQIWLQNIPILNTHVHRPTEVNFSLIDRFRIYRALNRCRSRKIISLLTR